MRINVMFGGGEYVLFGISPLAICAPRRFAGAHGGLVLSEDPAIALIEAVAARRDRLAFAELFRLFAPRIKAFFRRGGAENSVAEDLTQEVLLTVWRKAGYFDRRIAAPTTWIFAIARNKRIDAIRREKRPEIDPTDPALENAPPERPDDRVEIERDAARLRAAVARLPEAQSRILQLAYFKDLSHGEIAAELGIPLGTVKSRTRLAFSRLRSLLGEVE